jgi:hypothetical protein
MLSNIESYCQTMLKDRQIASDTSVAFVKEHLHEASIAKVRNAFFFLRY